MSRADWQELVRRYCPKDKRPCNCGDAWETWIPAERRQAMRDGQYVGYWGCEHGCSAAQLATRDEIAGRLADTASEGRNNG